MSHRKFEAPRHGSLGFLPRKRCRRSRGKVKAFPQSRAEDKPHFTGFIGFKAGMTHVVRDIVRRKSRLHEKEALEAVTIIDCPPMRVAGIVGYVETPRGLRTLATAWGSHLSDAFRRRLYKNWYRSKHKAFTHHMDQYNREDLLEKLALMKKHCQVIRVIAHTQPHMTPLALKKAQIIEIQINGGSVEDRVDFALSKLETEVRVNDVFSTDDTCDTIAITKGRGFEGATTRWGTRILTRKSNHGSRIVACVGPWHPSALMRHVNRAGQNGYHHRTEINKRIFRVWEAGKEGGASTEHDITVKDITPMGGFVRYGEINNDWIMIRGCCPGVCKRAITLRKPLVPCRRRDIVHEPANIKFIDTSSKMGHGRFQSKAEKLAFYSR